jgi:uncharacterized protein YxjI
MNLTIQQRTFTFSATYNIQTPSASYVAHKAFFSFNDSVTITSSNDTVLARIEGHLSLFKMPYDFQLSDGRAYHFRCTDMNKRVFLCEGKNESYTLYQHKGLRFSIFAGNRQIAAITKTLYTIGSANRYEIAMDSDANQLVVLCMILTISVNYDAKSGSNPSLKMDPASMGPEERSIDPNWKPR